MGILSGMRVVEGSAFVAIPLAGMTLAQMGAEVIRFDRIEGGLDAGRWPVTAEGRSLFWAGLNKGKKSVAVDLQSPEGREIVTRIVTAPGPDAGLFLTNLRVRGWLDYPTLSALRPDLVMVTLLGDRHGRPQVDYTVNPAVGFPDATGPDVENNPYKLVVASFQVPWMTLIYVLAMIALGLHLAHGVFSAMQTLGWTSTAASYRRAKLLGHTTAVVIAGGFLIPPLAILFGLIK